jgi:hypothetical protein
MKDPDTRLQRAKGIISSVCKMLTQSRLTQPVFGSALYGSADCYVVLSDATKLFCEAVCARHGEGQCRRWSPVLPELLFAYPERCEETLALIEQRDFRDLSYFQFTAA